MVIRTNITAALVVGSLLQACATAPAADPLPAATSTQLGNGFGGIGLGAPLASGPPEPAPRPAPTVEKPRGFYWADRHPVLSAVLAVAVIGTVVALTRGHDRKCHQSVLVITQGGTKETQCIN